MTKVAPNQLHLRSKFIVSPLATPGQQTTTASRQVMVHPHTMPNPTHHPWLLPEGGVSSSQVQGKQGMEVGGGVPFGPHEVGSAPPPSTDQRSASSMPGPWSKGAGSRDELYISVSWRCPDPIVFFHGPKWTLPVLLITLGRTTSFQKEHPDKRGASVPLAIWSQNNRKSPREKKKKAQPAHSFK